ncbi:hypothetical protein [Aquisalibacillus elongatus]|uniref:Permease n=1 Tax=Aquisalibacillus elongatus TaxID=485577 RepID=A0A3N5B545_9BACI|nr:hypothetical protein [Aquisalibacillus elongatus]RPF52229.1 hypothetical protein EDC24_2221 [Aquisalibacillus elongatus]
MSKQYDRKLYLIFGVFFIFITAIINIATITAGTFPAGHDVILIALTIIVFCNAYLAPQFIQNDERTKKIKERGMFYSYFFILGYMMLMMTLLYFEILNISAYQAVTLLTGITVPTVFISFVILSFKY